MAMDESTDSCPTTEAVSSVTEPCTSETEPELLPAPVRAGVIRTRADVVVVSSDTEAEEVGSLDADGPEVVVDPSLLTDQQDIMLNIGGPHVFQDRIENPRQKRTWRLVKSKAKWPPWIVGSARRGAGPH